MADVFTPEQRSANMSAIRSKDTKPEVYIRKKLFALGYRYRKNDSKVCGHPDMYLARYKTAVFVHGCYWHRHKDCRYAYTPKSNTDFWQKKFDANVQRDTTVRNELCENGIKCLIIWECTVKAMIKSEPEENRVMKEITGFLSSDEMYCEI